MMSEEPPRIIIKIPALNYNESINLKSRNLQSLDNYVEFCERHGAPECYSAFEFLLFREYIFRNMKLGKDNLKGMVNLQIDKMFQEEGIEN